MRTTAQLDLGSVMGYSPHSVIHALQVQPAWTQSRFDAVHTLRLCPMF